MVLAVVVFGRRSPGTNGHIWVTIVGTLNRQDDSVDHPLKTRRTWVPLTNISNGDNAELQLEFHTRLCYMLLFFLCRSKTYFRARVTQVSKVTLGAWIRVFFVSQFVTNEPHIRLSAAVFQLATSSDSNRRFLTSTMSFGLSELVV